MQYLFNISVSYNTTVNSCASLVDSAGQSDCWTGRIVFGVCPELLKTDEVAKFAYFKYKYT